MRTADDEEQRLTDYAMKRIGDMRVTHVRCRDIDAILLAAKASLSRETLRKLRGVLDRMFESLCKAEVIKENPVNRSEIPDGARIDDRPRTILTDAEIMAFLEGRASGPNGKKPRKDAERRLHELKVMAVCSRVLGGLRTAEVNRWSWDMVVDPDCAVQAYATVKVRRAKAKRGHDGKVQTFGVPGPMRPILRAWHELHGCPMEGPVFPVTKGDRKGEQRSERGTSYANRLRRELLRMGIKRQAIHKDTPTSKRVDFHSFRRAFASSLAEAGVNEQRAMILTAHADSKTHALYVQASTAMQVIPEGAVQMLPPGPLTAPIGTAVPLRVKATRKTPEKEARPVRFELTTFGFEGRGEGPFRRRNCAA